jgi:hypothetical protein
VLVHSHPLTHSNLESIRKRFETYVKETRPVIDAFEAKGQCWRVIADRPVEAISAELKSLVSSKLSGGVVSSTRTSTNTTKKRKGPEPRRVRVGGVPEHFNAPWHLAMRRGAFASVGAFVDWTVYPGGTGDMAKAVSEHAVDVALMLTEGAVVAALKDPRIKVVGVFVSTPAVWGIHAGAASCQQAAIADMKESANFAVSRMGSGSHLMAYMLRGGGAACPHPRSVALHDARCPACLARPRPWAAVAAAA